MFGIDDFAVWFAWYFVTDLVVHPTGQRMAEDAQTAIVGPRSAGVEAEDPQRLLDWLAEKGARPPPPWKK